MRAAGAERALHVQQDVLRLDVAVHDPGGVRGGQPVGDVRDDRDRGLRGEPALAVEAGAQIGAAYEVHDEREVVAVDDEVADADDLGVVQAEQRGALLDEAADEFLVGREVLAQQLDGDGPFGPLAQPHRAGAAAPQDLVGGVPAADLPCQDCSDVSGSRASAGADVGVKATRVPGGFSAPDGANLHFCGRNHSAEVDKSTESAAYVRAAGRSARRSCGLRRARAGRGREIQSATFEMPSPIASQ